MKRTVVLGFILGVLLLIGGSVAGSRLQKNNAEQAKKQLELAKYRAELVDATPVQFGVLTDKQRVHSRLFTYYHDLTGKRPLSRLAAQAKGKGDFVGIDVAPGLGPELTEPETPEHYFGRLARKSDAIIRGRVTSKTSQITEDDSFVFTDYDIVVAEIIMNNRASRIDTGATITVTRPGGKVVLNDVIVTATDATFEPLSFNQDIVLFLKFIPETGTYQATEATGSFGLNGSFLHPLTKDSFPPGALQNKGSFLQTLRVISKEQ